MAPSPSPPSAAQDRRFMVCAPQGHHTVQAWEEWGALCKCACCKPLTNDLVGPPHSGVHFINGLGGTWNQHGTVLITITITNTGAGGAGMLPMLAQTCHSPLGWPPPSSGVHLGGHGTKTASSPSPSPPTAACVHQLSMVCEWQHQCTAQAPVGGGGCWSLTIIVLPIGVLFESSGCPA